MDEESFVTGLGAGVFCASSVLLFVCAGCVTTGSLVAGAGVYEAAGALDRLSLSRLSLAATLVVADVDVDADVDDVFDEVVDVSCASGRSDTSTFANSDSLKFPLLPAS